MLEKIDFPVYICEIETGDISIYRDISELRLIVEEFWDILEKEFKFWDRNGFLLSFEQAFLNGENRAIKQMKNQTRQLKFYLSKYAEKKGIDIQNYDDVCLSDISKTIWGKNIQ